MSERRTRFRSRWRWAVFARAAGAVLLLAALLATIFAFSDPKPAPRDAGEPHPDARLTIGFDLPGPAVTPSAPPSLPVTGPPPGFSEEVLRSLSLAPRSLRLAFFLSLASLALYLAARCYLYSRYGLMAVAGADVDDHVAPPLPGQENVLGRLVRLISNRSPDDEGALLALKGSWGSGKSYLLRRLRYELDLPGDGTQAAAPAAGRPATSPLVVQIDIWRHSSERDLHFALLEALLSHPEAPPAPAFFSYPLSLVPSLILRYLTRVFQRGQVEVGGLRLALSLPPLIWQPTLERMIWQVRRRERSLVWILDEIDRSSPEMAQAAISLARRALNLPGCLVLLSYVPDQLRFKVFNPLRISRPDISSTIQAVLWEYALRSDRSRSVEEALFSQDGRVPDAFSRLWDTHWTPWKKGDEAAKGTESSDMERDEVLAFAEPAATLGRTVTWGLGRWYAQCPENVRERLSFLFEEKYLSHYIDVPPLSAQDIVRMVRHFPTLRPLYHDFVRHHGLFDHDPDSPAAEAEHETLGADLIRALEAYRRDFQIPDRTWPMIRHLEGDLIALLTPFAGAGGPGALAPKSLEPRAYARATLAFLTILAFRRSVEQVRSLT